METVRIEFTPEQARAVLHRLEQAESIAYAFLDTDWLEHLADGAQERAQALGEQLQHGGWILARVNEQDAAILLECIQGSTYMAECVHGGGHDVAKRALSGAAARIEQAYGMEEGAIYLPGEE